MSDRHDIEAPVAAPVDEALELVRDGRRKISSEQLGLSPCPDDPQEITLWLFEVAWVLLCAKCKLPRIKKLFIGWAASSAGEVSIDEMREILWATWTILQSKGSEA